MRIAGNRNGSNRNYRKLFGNGCLYHGRTRSAFLCRHTVPVSWAIYPIGSSPEQGVPLRVVVLTKQYKSIVAVEGLSLRVDRGTVYALIGPNGAGNSSVLHCIVRTRKPSSGYAELFGYASHELPNARRRVGFCGEFAGLDNRMRVEQQISSSVHAYRPPSRRSAEVLEDCGLSSLAGSSIKKLSTGERMRVSIAIALIGEPELLVLDEPTNGLDTAGIRWIRELLRNHAASGVSVLLTSQILSEVEQVADALTVLNRTPMYQGQLSSFIGQGSSLEEAYFGLILDGGNAK